jgi:hypothetical protein
MKTLLMAAAIAGALLVALQFVPVDTSNPPVTANIETPADVKEVLQRSCYDCHSNETRWPWYSRIAPFSWLVAHDVEEGREHLNFSEWDQLSAEDQIEAMEEAWEEVEEGEMPLWFYLPMHPEARISAADRAVLRRWAGGSGHDD